MQTALLNADLAHRGRQIYPRDVGATNNFPAQRNVANMNSKRGGIISTSNKVQLGNPVQRRYHDPRRDCRRREKRWKTRAIACRVLT